MDVQWNWSKLHQNSKVLNLCNSLMDGCDCHDWFFQSILMLLSLSLLVFFALPRWPGDASLSPMRSTVNYIPTQFNPFAFQELPVILLSENISPTSTFPDFLLCLRNSLSLLKSPSYSFSLRELRCFVENILYIFSRISYLLWGEMIRSCRISLTLSVLGATLCSETITPGDGR